MKRRKWKSWQASGVADLIDLKITTVRSALYLLHVVSKVSVLQAEVDRALHALVALGQLLMREPLQE